MLSGLSDLFPTDLDVEVDKDSFVILISLQPEE